MGYNSDTKLVTKPIDTTDIAAALGVASRDVGTLCTTERINMWAKYKPIKFAKWSELTERDIISAHDPADNIFFGIKITGPINGVFDHTLDQLHTATFTYIRPEGGALEPFRMTDFNNYKHNAKPNPNASFHIKDRDGEQLVGYCNDKDDQYGSLTGIEVGYDGTNIWGVDFTAMYSDGDGKSGETLENNLKRSYPCILVTDESTGKSYFTALDYPILGQKSVARPLYYNGSGVSSQNWSVRFEKPTYSNGVNMGVSDKAPWQSFKDGLKATLFLVKSWDIDGPFLDAAKTQDFSKYWMELSAAGSAYQGAARPIVLPADKLGAPLTIRRKGASSVYYRPIGVTYDGTFIRITCEKVGSTDETVKLESSARLDGITATKTAVDVSPLFNPMISFTASDFGMQTFMPNMKYTIKVTLTTTDSSGSTVQTETFEFTA